MAACVVADSQPAKHGNFVVTAKNRVWMKVVRVLVPSFVLPFAVKREPHSLGELVGPSVELGTDAVMVVSRNSLRDANHEAERRLADERAKVAQPVASEGIGDARFDAL